MTLGDEEKEQKAVRVELTAMKHALEQIRLAALALARRAGQAELQTVLAGTAQSQFAVAALLRDLGGE